jgi:hypothetical protein
VGDNRITIGVRSSPRRSRGIELQPSGAKLEISRISPASDAVDAVRHPHKHARLD